MSIVNLTEHAAAKVRELIDRDQRPGFGLRVKVVGGGCSGLQYQLMFDNQIGELDQTEDVHGVKVMVDSKSAVYLVGTTVDYVDELNRSGFKIENPNASNTCGCGESFGV
jgi:iron-sulfur cluster assembly accessory protein